MKKTEIIAVTLALAGLASMSAYAGTWEQNAQGWWYNNGNGTWPANTWQWIDGNGDGTAECYYFDANGYCLMNTTALDGYSVDANGAWTVNGVVQTKAVGNTTSNTADGTYRAKFKQSDIKKMSGRYTITFKTYTLTTYPKSYVMGLKVGDTVNGIKIYSISKQGDSYNINTTSLNGESAWFEKVQGSNDLYNLFYEDGYGTWSELGQITVPVASDAVFVDNKDNYSGGTGKQYTFAELASNSALYSVGFDADNAIITVKDGTVVEVKRSYLP